MRFIFIGAMILFLLTACGADAQPAAPTATVTISPTFTLTPTKVPTATTTPVESQFPKGTRIDVDTAKEGWVDEFPGLEEHVRTNEDGTTSFVLGDMVLLDLDGKVMAPEKTEFDYTPEGTVFKFAGEDRIWVGGWEFSKNAEGKYEFVDVVRILAPRPDAEGNVEDPASVLPHLNKEDTALLKIFKLQTGNIDIFDDGTFATSRRGLTPDHWKFRDSSSGFNPGYVFFLPVGEEGRQNKFVDLEKSGQGPIIVQVDNPSLYVNDLGTMFTSTILDSTGETILTNSIILDKTFKRNASKLDGPLWFGMELFDGNPDNQVEIFLLENNTQLLEIYGKKSRAGDVRFKDFGDNLDTIQETFFVTGYTSN